MSGDKSTAPFIDATSRMKISMGALVGILFTAVAGGAAWAWIRSDVRGNTASIAVHEKRLDSVETKIASDHDILLEIRADVKAITRDRRADERNIVDR